MNVHDRRKALLARTSTATLLDSARLLDVINDPTQEERMVRAWVFDELESRVGEITLDEEPAFEEFFDRTGSYLKALLALRPALGQEL